MPDSNIIVSGGGGSVETTTTTYTYTASLAVAICEGAISEVVRVWADAKQLDLTAGSYGHITCHRDITAAGDVAG